eukprot:3932134-Rhodomonas_salina.1
MSGTLVGLGCYREECVVLTSGMLLVGVVSNAGEGPFEGQGAYAVRIREGKQGKREEKRRDVREEELAM